MSVFILLCYNVYGDSMKKLLLLVCLLFILCGCNKKNIDTPVVSNSFELKKVDDNRDYVYSKVLGTYFLPDKNNYNLEEIIINIDSMDASNVNMELRSFVKKSIVNNNSNDLLNGYMYSYNYYVSNNYLSLVVNYKYINNGIIGDEDFLVYVLSLNTGKIVDNKVLLSDYKKSEDDLYNYVQSNINSDDAMYSVKSMKDNGYNLYVDKNNRLVVVFNEVTDDEQIKKELILN